MGSSGRAALGSWVLVKGWVQASGFWREDVSILGRWIVVSEFQGMGGWVLIGGFRVR